MRLSLALVASSFAIRTTTLPDAVAGALVLAARRESGPGSVCYPPRCPQGHVTDVDGRCWTCEGPPGPTRWDF